jgi:protein-tyrosine phosphatase
MLTEFVDWTLKSKNEDKAIIHCSSGVGRTGTTIALNHILILMHAQMNMGVQDPVFSTMNTVRRLRESRYGSVMTID